VKQLLIPGIGGGVLPGELIVDLFAGGGGASLGLEMALGRSPDIAINHDPHAVQMHAQNHPATHHRCESIYTVDPVAAVEGQPVGVLWASPDCRHFSKAKGSAPVSKAVRGLAWMILRWAARTSPRVIFMENVEEFVTWGPVRKGKPVKKHAGRDFAKFKAQLQALGYAVEHRVLKACDYGAPTIRKRLFLVARCDGEAIKWPEPTHGPKRAKPYRAAAEVIDFNIPCPSIFLTPTEAKALGVKRPLAPATCRRIAAGLVRFVLTAAQPFIIRCCHTGDDAGKVKPLGDPLSTITSKNEHCVVAPSIVAIGERHGGGNARTDQPMGTLLTTERHALVSAFLAKHYDQPSGAPLAGSPMSEPVPTITTKGIQINAVAAHLVKFRHDSAGADLPHPLPTITGGGNAGGRPAGAAHAMGIVAAFLVHYYGTGGQSQDLREPLATVVSRARTGLVTVTVEGQEYAVVDIGMRMLTPAELAAAQGFPSDYILTGTKAEKIKRIGNSVCPPVAAALAGANIPRPSRVKRGAA
jgi:DNA (cytosine-5)-methyltransferase 1